MSHSLLHAFAAAVAPSADDTARTRFFDMLHQYHPSPKQQLIDDIGRATRAASEVDRAMTTAYRTLSRGWARMHAPPRYLCFVCKREICTLLGLLDVVGWADSDDSDSGPEEDSCVCREAAQWYAARPFVHPLVICYRRSAGDYCCPDCCLMRTFEGALARRAAPLPVAGTKIAVYDMVCLPGECGFACSVPGCSGKCSCVARDYAYYLCEEHYKALFRGGCVIVFQPDAPEA